MRAPISASGTRGACIFSLARALSRYLRLPRSWSPLLVLALAALPALAGPPFQTDDPDPLPYRHFETYAFELSDGTRAGGANLQFPAWEMNWGGIPNGQLHIVVPLVTSFAPAGGPVNFGIGDIELGVKYRFVKEADKRPEIGVYPFVELPSGNAARGLGVGKTWYRLPLWLQKSWGDWTTYGGGGAVVANAPGYQNYPFAGWLLQRKLSEKLTLGGEIFGHGAEGSASTSPRSSTMADFGGYYTFHDGFQLLFGAGHSFAGEGETYTYLALYWTWGGGSQSQQPNPSNPFLSRR